MFKVELVLYFFLLNVKALPNKDLFIPTNVLQVLTRNPYK